MNFFINISITFCSNVQDLLVRFMIRLCKWYAGEGNLKWKDVIALKLLRLSNCYPRIYFFLYDKIVTKKNYWITKT